MTKLERLKEALNEASLAQPSPKSMAITSKDGTTTVEIAMDGPNIVVDISNGLSYNFEEDGLQLDLDAYNNLDMLDYITYKGLDIEFRELVDEIEKMLKHFLNKTKNNLKSEIVIQEEA